MNQLAQTVTDFIEPVIPYLVIGSKKAAEEAGKRVGPEVWELENQLWGKLCSRVRPELKEAAGDLVVAPSDPELKQVLVREVLKSFEMNPDFAKEISVFMEEELIRKLTAEQRMTAFQQSPADKTGVLEEFNKLLEEFVAKYSIVQDSERLEAGPGKEEIMEKEALMQKTLDFASRIQYGDARSLALSLLVPHLEGPGKQELIKKALSSASNIHDEAERAAVLSSLVPHLSGPGKEELIEDILDFAPYIQYGDTKFQVFSSLVPHLEGSGNDGSENERLGNEILMEKALEMASGIQSEYLRVQALSLLIPYLKGQRKEETIEQALELASNIKDKNMRSLALSFVDPYLNGPGKEEGVEGDLVQDLSFNEQPKSKMN
ncbi:hypothetical protein [Methanosarcina sp. MTP4]|uniref:hypothetical protein n=1 Tax=Methanosarcina sp. MTP4 TaxID=1434100 RepID=UPI0012E06689|nr:hypothetical protein [Methanosarcina sp. MTP4]